jgi:hypothetical protein
MDVWVIFSEIRSLVYSSGEFSAQNKPVVRLSWIL